MVLVAIKNCIRHDSGVFFLFAADEAKIATNSMDVIQLLKTLQELLQNAIQKKRPTRLWESVYTISGPLTWKDFHLLAGRGWQFDIRHILGRSELVLESPRTFLHFSRPEKA